MISEKQARRYCREDISLIENYNVAVTSPEKWVCHHRGEILPCGRYSAKTLKKFGLYKKRPASELIFMSESEHRKMHNLGNQYMYGKHHTEESREKMRQLQLGEKNSFYGKHHTEATREKMRQSHHGEKNHFYGRHHTESAKKKISQAHHGEKNYWYGTHWFTNGVESVRAKECPPGFVPGRIKRKSAA